MNIQLESNRIHYFIISPTLEFGVNNGYGGMLPRLPSPTFRTEAFIPQLLGVLISDNINQLDHPAKPGPLLTQSHPHCLSSAWVQRLIDAVEDRPGLSLQFWTISKNHPCTTASCSYFNVSLCLPWFLLSYTGIYARSSPQSTSCTQVSTSECFLRSASNTASNPDIQALKRTQI